MPFLGYLCYDRVRTFGYDFKGQDKHYDYNFVYKLQQFQENISETEKDIEEHEKEISQLKRRLGSDQESYSESKATDRQKTNVSGEENMEMGEERSARIALSRIHLENDSNNADSNDDSETDFTQSLGLSSQEL